jgi:hypothetical protein
MANSMFGTPIHSDAAELSQGTWSSSLPLTNMQHRLLSKKARSSAATTASTKFDTDLGILCRVGAFALCAHNLSLASKARISASERVDFGELQTIADNISASPWVDQGTPVVAAVTGPNSTSSGYNINDNDGASVEYRAVTLSTSNGDGVKPLGIWVKKGTATVSVIQVRDTTAPADRLLATITWSGASPGTPSMGTGTFVSKEEGVSDWWWLRFTTAAITAANTNDLRLYGATDTGAATGTTSYAFPSYCYRNVILSSDITAGSGWTSSGSPILTAITGPDGSTGTGHTIEDDAAGAVEYRTYTLLWVGNATKALNIWVKQGTATASAIVVRDSTAVAERLNAAITWSGGAPGTPTMTAGTYVSQTAGDNGWYLLRFLTSSVTASNTNVLRLYGASTTVGALGSSSYAYPWTEDGTTAYEHEWDSMWDDVFTDIYPPGVLNAGEPGYSDGELTQAQLDAGYQYDLIAFPTAGTIAQFWRTELDDTTNAAGYVEIGRLVIANGYQPTINFSNGASLGVQTSTTRTETDGGAFYFNERPRRRLFNGVIEYLGIDEALVRLYEMERLLGTHEQFLFVYDPADTYHLHRRAFVATLAELSPMSMPYAPYGSKPIAVVEEVP